MISQIQTDIKLEHPRIPIQPISDEITENYQIKLFLKRDDLLHPEISGNKWYKLKYNLIDAREKGYNTLLTFGGAYSNHIYATAAAGKIFDFKTIGIIRGEEHIPLNQTLSFAKFSGMDLHYVSRSEYRKKNEKEFIEKLKNKFGEFYLIPEGGKSALAVKGAEEIVKNINTDFDFICTACGTGTTLAGIISGLNGNKKAIGFAALKGAYFLKKDIKELLKVYNNKGYSNWDLILDYHFGGFAKVQPELVKFIYDFQNKHKIKIDPIYNAKMLYGIYDLIKKGYLPENSKIIAIHSGGIQGNKSMQNKLSDNFNPDTNSLFHLIK